jgi:PilZ domain
VEEAHPQPERRSPAYYAVDTETSLLIVNHGGALRPRMFELSLDGCRVRADRHFPMVANVGVEVTFKINGIGFRLAGTMQFLDARQTAAIQFCPMPQRRREALEDLLDELRAQKQAEEKAELQAQADSKPPKEARKINRRLPDRERVQAGILSMPAGVRRHEIRSVAPRPTPPPNISSLAITIPTPDSAPAAPVTGPAATLKPAARPSARDRRQQARQAVDTWATVYFIDVRAQIPGRILDLSMSGCRIRTDQRFPVGIYRRVETEFKLDGMPFRLAGVVQSLHDRFTVGIRFLDMSMRKREQLQELMQEIAERKESGNGE